MAYVNKETKEAVTPAIKAVLTKYGMKGTISGLNSSTLCVNISSGRLVFNRDYIQVNQYWIDNDYTGEVRDFLNELLVAMKGTIWYDKSDIMIDYFHTAYYISINIGAWKKPYKVIDMIAA